MSPLRKLGMLNREGMKACNSGNLNNAMFLLTQADSIARGIQSPLHEAKVRNSMGLVHILSGDREQAMGCFRLAERKSILVAGPGNILHKIIAKNIARLETAHEAEAA